MKTEPTPAPDTEGIKEKVRHLPHGPGVYLMKDRFGAVLYVGKAKDLKKRIATYFQQSRRQQWEHPKIHALIGLIHDFDIIEVKSETEALLLEGKLIKEWRPRYNTDFTDDKRFLLVRLDTRPALPRFRLARVRNDERSRYFGPFPHSGLLRRTLNEMRRRFGILLGDAQPESLPDGRWRLYSDARAELYGHPNIVTEAEYAARIAAAAAFLDGKSKEWLSQLRSEMEAAAAAREYEKAAGLRDAIHALEQTLSPSRKFRRIPASGDSGDAPVPRLQRALGLSTPPRSIECFDISHISGSYCVASMVRFEEGSPAKNRYRRYKIRSFVGNDDYRALEEVVGRRYRRLRDESQPFPDLVVIDGGAGQVTAALKAFLWHSLEPPPLIGLAKRDERIVFSDGRDPLVLSRTDPALHLLQRLRDEAHRFANTFNAQIRSRRLRESILDDFPGLGPRRRAALLHHFRTIQALRRASPEELQEVPGFGRKLAHQLHAFLRQERER